jgi:hypothetical protein
VVFTDIHVGAASHDQPALPVPAAEPPLPTPPRPRPRLRLPLPRACSPRGYPACSTPAWFAEFRHSASAFNASFSAS